MSIAIAIPARGGSKRIPRKNVKLLRGKPLISYTIETALKSKMTPDVWVCTEDQEIADISESCGARVYRIPNSMAGDDVSSTVPCLDLLDHLEKHYGKDFEFLFNLQPTSPLRSVEDLWGSYSSFIRAQKDFLVSVTEIDPHYFHWALKGNEDAWAMYFGSKYMKERIHLEKVYRPNGAIKLAKVGALRKSGNYFGEGLSVYSMPEERSIHIGNYFDFKCTEAMLDGRE
jgi:CMP-N,N'-diacetyllegionaminic acid synthase